MRATRDATRRWLDIESPRRIPGGTDEGNGVKRSEKNLGRALLGEKTLDGGNDAGGVEAVLVEQVDGRA